MEENNEDPIFDNLNMRQMTVNKKKTVELIPIDQSDAETLENDLDEIRSNVQDLIEKGTDLLDEIIIVAKSSQDPKAFREASVAMKVLLDANKGLTDIVIARKDVLQAQNGDSGPKNVTNNLYVGSTSDALEIARARRDEKNEN